MAEKKEKAEAAPEGDGGGKSKKKLIMFIIIVGVGLAGVLTVFNVTARSSADPVVRKQALAIAEEVEEQSAVYWGTLAIGGPKLLDKQEMDTILQRFKSYGQKS